MKVSILLFYVVNTFCFIIRGKIYFLFNLVLIFVYFKIYLIFQMIFTRLFLTQSQKACKPIFNSPTDLVSFLFLMLFISSFMSIYKTSVHNTNKCGYIKACWRQFSSTRINIVILCKYVYLYKERISFTHQYQSKKKIAYTIYSRSSTESNAI